MNLAQCVHHIGPVWFDPISGSLLWSGVKLIRAGTPVGAILGKKTAFRKILYGALWGSSNDVVLPTLWHNGRSSEKTSGWVPAGLLTSSSKPQGRELEHGSPLLHKKDKMGWLVPMYTLHWPSSSLTDVTNNKECQTASNGGRKLCE